MTAEVVTILALKYGDVPHYQWKGTVLAQTPEYIVVSCAPKRKLQHYTRDKVFTMENGSIEFFSLVHGYTAAMEVRDGEILSYYCNICQPAAFNEGTIRFVDLDVDIVQRGGQWQVIDEEEFVENSERYHYPKRVIEQTKVELESLWQRINERKFPFDGYLEQFIPEISLRK